MCNILFRQIENMIKSHLSEEKILLQVMRKRREVEELAIVTNQIKARQLECRCFLRPWANKKRK